MSQRKGESREDYLARERELGRAKWRAKREALGLPYVPYGERPALTPEEIERRRKRQRQWEADRYRKMPPDKKRALWNKRHARKVATPEGREQMRQWAAKWRVGHPRYGPIYGPPKPPPPPRQRGPIYGPAVPASVKYEKHKHEMRARYWVGPAIHDPGVRSVVDVYLTLRDELR